jgi:N-acetylneuraminic acid mutarotase
MVYNSSVSRLWFVAASALAGACASTPPAPDAPISAWSMGPAAPRRAFEPGVTALGLDVVVAGGYDTSAAEGADITAQIDVFDTSTGVWGGLPDAPVRWVAPGLAGLGSTLYLVGGLEGPQRVARGQSFALDPLTHVWQAIQSMPAGLERGAAGVVASAGRIYVLGGAGTSAPLASCLVYELATDSWTPLPDLPQPRVHLAVMRRSDGALIASGGFASLDASDPRGDTWVLPPLAAAWVPASAMRPPGDPDLRGGCAYGAVLGQLICAGGQRGATALRAVDSDDPFAGQWTTAEAMPVDRAGAAGAVVGGRLFVVGGAPSGAIDPSDALYVYAPLSTAH